MTELTSKQRKFLEKSAHSLEPIVIIGGNGLTSQVIEMILKSLDAHELLKVKFNDFKDEKSQLTQEICAKTDATLVRMIGNIAIIFKQNKNPEKQKYKI